MNKLQDHSYKTSARGYVALMTAILLSVLFMTLTLAANTTAFIARADLSQAEDHLQAKHFAAACGAIALRILAIDPSRLTIKTPMQIQLTQDTSCTITSGISSEATAQATVRAHSATSLALLYIHAARASSTAPFTPDYWSELPPQ